jgi:hypothetical protein
MIGGPQTKAVVLPRWLKGKMPGEDVYDIRIRQDLSNDLFLNIGQ